MKRGTRYLLVMGLVVLMAGVGPLSILAPQPAYGKTVKTKKVKKVKKVKKKEVPLTLIIQPGTGGQVSVAEQKTTKNVYRVDLKANEEKQLTMETTTAKTTKQAEPLSVTASASVLAAPAVRSLAVASEDLTALPKVLVVYDAPPGVAYSKFGQIYAIMLRNLIGHFKQDIELLPVEDYTAGKVEEYSSMFYLGGYFDNPLPDVFLNDVVSTQKTVVWFRYNIWKLAWDGRFDFNNRFGFAYYGNVGLNAPPSPTNPEPGFFDTVLYKDKELKKYYGYDETTGSVYADPDVGYTQVLDPAKAEAVVWVKNSVTQQQLPYIIRSGNFWYFADLPLSYIGPRDRYLVAADILHDILGIDHAEEHKAMVRLEDVSAWVQYRSMRLLSNYMFNQQIPFAVAAVPVYMDPFGKYNGGVAQEIHLAEATTLVRSLNYAVSKGGSILLHGKTHQYEELLNPHSGVTGDDFEFWSVVTNSPVPDDSISWATERIGSGIEELEGSGFSPFVFETPHYQGSPNSYAASSDFFVGRYGRAYYYTSDDPQLNLAVGDPNRDFSAGQFFPYIIYEDYYGQIVLPENLGNIEYDISHIDPTSNVHYPWTELITNAEYAKVVRDGYGSFFFHPFWLEAELGVPGFSDFKKLVTGITALGYTWVGAEAELNAADAIPTP